MILSRPRASIAAALAAALLATMLPSVPALAADDSNIPGVPLPGPTVTGLLGGPIYDHVYSIDVPTDRVILLALTGDPGTDFDLYLFDSSAGTIYMQNGQVAASTSDSSTESITYATQGGGRFYLDVNGATEVQGQFRLTVHIAADMDPPIAELHLDDDAVATPDSAVRVRLVATDDLSGVTEMQFSVDGNHWDGWRPYVPFTLWAFPQVDGSRTVWARVRDRSGNLSQAVTATIVIDSVQPTVLSRSPGPEDVNTGLRPVFQVVFSEPILPATWTTLGLLLQDQGGRTVPGVYLYDHEKLTGTFSPTPQLTPGAVYLATVGAVTDLAGNPVAPIGSWVVRPLRSPTLSLNMAERTATYGEVLTISGHVTLPIDGTLTLERSVTGGSWETVGALSPDGSGDLTARIVAKSSGQMRLHLAASTTAPEAFSAAVGVTVRRAVSLRDVSATATREIRVGTAVSLRGLVSPDSPKATIVFSVYRYSASRRVWVFGQSTARGTVAGVAAWTWKPTAPGRYYIRLTTAAIPGLAPGVSSAYRWTVS